MRDCEDGMRGIVRDDENEWEKGLIYRCCSTTVTAVTVTVTAVTLHY